MAEHALAILTGWIVAIVGHDEYDLLHRAGREIRVNMSTKSIPTVPITVSVLLGKQFAYQERGNTKPQGRLGYSGDEGCRTTRQR